MATFPDYFDSQKSFDNYKSCLSSLKYGDTIVWRGIEYYYLTKVENKYASNEVGVPNWIDYELLVSSKDYSRHRDRGFCRPANYDKTIINDLPKSPRIPKGHIRWLHSYDRITRIVKRDAKVKKEKEAKKEEAKYKKRASSGGKDAKISRANEAPINP